MTYAMHRDTPQLPGWLDSVHLGWHGIVMRTHEKLLVVVPDYRVSQLKEKFGGLRIYLNGISQEQWDAVNEIIAEAEEEAARTCEFCGHPGSIRQKPSGWLQALCENCFERYPKREDIE